MTDQEKVMSWLEGLSQDDWRQFHSDSEVSNIAKAALDLLKEQEYVPLEPVVMYLSHYATPPEMYPGIHTPEEERELWRKTLKSIK